MRDVYQLVTENGILRIAQIFTDKLTTKELCVEDVCVTREQFLQMVQQAGITSQSPTPPPEAISPSNSENPENEEIHKLKQNKQNQ